MGQHRLCMEAGDQVVSQAMDDEAVTLQAEGNSQIIALVANTGDKGWQGAAAWEDENSAGTVAIRGQEDVPVRRPQGGGYGELVGRAVKGCLIRRAVSARG